MAEPDKGYKATDTGEVVTTGPGLVVKVGMAPEVETLDLAQEEANRRESARALELREARAEWDKKTHAEQALAGKKEWSMYGEDHPLSEYYTADEMNEPDFFDRRWAELGVYREEGDVQYKDPTMQWMHDRLKADRIGLYEDPGLISAFEEFYDSRDPRQVQDRAARVGVVYDNLSYHMNKIMEVETATGLSANKEAYQEAVRRALHQSWGMLKQTSTAMAGAGRAGLSHLFKDGWEEKLVKGDAPRGGKLKGPKWSPQRFGHESHPVMSSLELNEQYLRRWSVPGMSPDSPQAKHLEYMLDYRADVYRALRGEAGVEVVRKQENGKITVDGKEVPVWQHFGYPTEKVFRDDLKRTGAAVMNRRVVEMYNDGVRSVPEVMAAQIPIIDNVLASAEQQIKDFRLKDIEFLMKRGDDAYKKLSRALGSEFLGIDVSTQAFLAAMEKSQVPATHENIVRFVNDVAGTDKAQVTEQVRSEVVADIVRAMQTLSPQLKAKKANDMAMTLLNALSGSVQIGNTSVPISEAIAQYAIPFTGTNLMHKATLLAYRYGMENDMVFARFVREWDPSNPEDLAQMRTYAHRNIEAARKAVGIALLKIGKSKSRTTASGVEFRVDMSNIDDVIMGAFATDVTGYGNVYMQHHFERGDLKRPKVPILKRYKPVDPNMLEWGPRK